jgi:hypothetical protein
MKSRIRIRTKLFRIHNADSNQSKTNSENRSFLAFAYLSSLTILKNENSKNIPYYMILYLLYFFSFRLLKTDFYDPTSGEAGGVSATCPPHPEEKGGGPGGGGGLPAALKLDQQQQRSSHPYFRGPAPGGPDPGKYDFRGGQLPPQLQQQQQQQQQLQQRYGGEDYRGGRPRPPYRAGPSFASDS